MWEWFKQWTCWWLSLRSNCCFWLVGLIIWHQWWDLGQSFNIHLGTCDGLLSVSPVYVTSLMCSLFSLNPCSKIQIMSSFFPLSLLGQPVGWETVKPKGLWPTGEYGRQKRERRPARPTNGPCWLCCTCKYVPLLGAHWGKGAGIYLQYLSCLWSHFVQLQGLVEPKP